MWLRVWIFEQMIYSMNKSQKAPQRGREQYTEFNLGCEIQLRAKPTVQNPNTLNLLTQEKK